MESLKSRAASMPWPTASCPSYLHQTGVVAASSTSDDPGWTMQAAKQSSAAVVSHKLAAALQQVWRLMQGACVDCLVGELNG